MISNGKIHQLMVKVDELTYMKFAQIAYKNNRTLQGEIRIIVRDWLK